jgi:hypothetical protein
MGMTVMPSRMSATGVLSAPIDQGDRMKALVFGLAAALCAAVPATAQDVGGRYRVAGKNLDGSPYSGTAEIVVTSRTTCRIRWTVGSTSSGICMRSGTAFSAAYVMGSVAGLVIYEMKPDGSLEGIWTIADKSGVGVEVLTPMR